MPEARILHLLRQLVVRQIQETTRASTLGLLWLVISPLLSMGLYLVVFGLLFGGSFGRIENESSVSYAVGIYIGLSIVNLVNESLTRSTGFLQQNRNLIKKVRFPVPILPLALVSGTGFKLLVNAALWLAMGTFVGSVLDPAILLLPLILLPVFLFTLGIAYFISSLSVFFRDIQQLTTVLSQIVFWSSGVFFSALKVQQIPALWEILRFNPVLLAIENIRSVVLWNLPPDPSQIAYLYLCAALALFVGFALFHRLQHGFSDYL